MTIALYIDESGDHTYKQVDNPLARYLALTAVVVQKNHYDSTIHPAVEALKHEHFTNDPDNPVILHRSDIVKRRRWFGVLQIPERQERWAADILSFFQTLQAQVLTVVIDKKVHKENYPFRTFDPYEYSLAVLLWRIRGFLVSRGKADVIAESRGKVEDRQILDAYHSLLTVGGGAYGTAPKYRDVFSAGGLTVRRKELNVTGIQLADLLAAGQKVDIALRNKLPVANPPSAFTGQLNGAAAHMINQYGRYLLK